MENIKTISDIYAIDKIIAIDPGKMGAIVVWAPNEDLKIYKMPETVKQVSNIFAEEKETTRNLLIVIEKVQMWVEDSKGQNRGKQFGIDKMMKNFNSLISAAEINEITYITPFPATWQSGLNFRNKGHDKTKRKNDYKQFAQTKFPEIKVTLWNADALCICEYIRRQISYNLPSVLKMIPQDMLYNIRITD